MTSTKEDELIRTFNEDGCRVQVNLTRQVLQIEAIDEGSSFEARVMPTLEHLLRDSFSPPLVSASMLALEAKQFDDGLYAAVERAVQTGLRDFGGKTALLKSLLTGLSQLSTSGDDDVATLLFAAARLGGLDVAVPAALLEPVKKKLAAFEADERRSKPIGFYTWNDELGRIFQQDRLLQETLEDAAGIERLARALHGEPPSRGIYESYLDFVSRLTNPLAEGRPDLRPLLKQLDESRPLLLQDDTCFLPPSRSRETDLMKKLFGPDDPIPEDFNLIDDVIQRIRAGSLPLTPTAESGWYDYQTWALEPLVIPEQMPEARKLNLDAEYRKQLEELFKGVFALTRETHVKQLECALLGEDNGEMELPRGPLIMVMPHLTAEPLYSYYLRRAVSYQFVQKLLQDFFGVDGLKQMHRLTADGPVALDLEQEVRQVSALFYGAHVTVARELGLPPQTKALGSGESADADAASFQRWAKAGRDPELSSDARMMVPVFFDRERDQTKVWAFLGWSDRLLGVSFASIPGVEVFDEDGNDVTSQAEINYGAELHSAAYPVFAEVYVSRILNREEFRAHCDRFQTRSAILQNLK